MMKKFLAFSLLILAFYTINGQGCTASWTFDDTEDLTIQFTDLSSSDPSDPIVSWSWDFDDGSTSTMQNPLHTFPDIDDKYDVELIITTQNGCTSSLEIRIEICGFTTSYSFGACDSNGNIPMTLDISDIHDNADEIDIILDGSNVPGSPFPIDQANPISVTFDVPGDGLSHSVLIQSTDIPTCFKQIDFTVADCNSNCFLSGLNAEYTPTGVTHTVDVGDNFFAPGSVSLDLGDEVEFIWVGDGHSTTSDATSGPDAWNSGVISAGSSFIVNINQPGVHPYYCIPHGGPGGVGMSGELLSNCPSGNTISLDVSFNTTTADPAGYDILWDGTAVPGSPFSYNGTGPQSQTINIAGDGMIHTLEIVDINDPTCTLSIDYDAPDCNQGGGNPVCSMSISTGAVGACDANNNISVELSVDVSNGGSGFFVSVDAGTPQFFNYNGNPTVVNIDVPGDGMSHSIDVEDDIDAACSDNTTITTTDCNLPCSITNVIATPPSGNGQASGIIHTVDVQDFQFSPAVISITEGDQVEWVWTGAVDHTSTSDATTGADSWDSGLQGQGTTYTSPVLSIGNHPYYCVPHGAPGGVGMAGAIDVLPPCNANNEVPVVITFDVSGPGASGYNVLVDGVTQGPFSYSGGTAQTTTIDVPGDNATHTITIEDIDDPACSGITNVTTPDCSGGGGGGPVCSLTMSASVNGTCDTNGNVPVELTVTPSNAGTSFTVFIDGQSAGNYNYAASGNTIVSVDVTGDGMPHLIEIEDDSDPNCTASASVTTPDCSLPCSITNLVATPPSGNGQASGILHSVEVQDFQFSPAVISISEGDQVEWVWTGAVDHTATSDATSGPDSWDSGLLGQGATYVSPVLSVGTHPYYCIPHGAPGGVGMAGTIDVLPPCNANNEVAVQVSFDVTGGGASGFNVLVDGLAQGPFSYSGGPSESVSVDVPGDDASHTITVQDIDDTSCNATTNVTTPDCSGGGGGGPVCSLTMSASVNGTCDTNGNVPVELTVTPSNAGTSFTVFIDGQSAGNYNYAASGNTIVSVDVTGDGMPHLIEIEDDSDPNCTASASVTTPDCSLPCSITNLMVSPPSSDGSPGGVLHTVSVEDFEFDPAIISISSGDQVEWIWTGAVDHTATSDASSGPDSWDSGLLGQGAVFTSPVLSEGSHPYYCIPHGAPGGVGMAGIINVLPPCNEDGEVPVLVNFDVEGAGSAGFNILVDGVVHGPFNYSGSTSQSVTVNVAGDDADHVIEVQDIQNSGCSSIAIVHTPDCSGGGGGSLECSLSLSASISGGCDSTMHIDVNLLVLPSNAGSGFSVNVDGSEYGSYTYNTTGSTGVAIQLPGDGQTHEVSVVDDSDSGCQAAVSITTPDCTLPCRIDSVRMDFTNNKKHEILVEDFVFIPKEIEVIQGDTLLFKWTGQIPHTVSSDAQTGSDVFDSGLLGQGSEFELILNNTGPHPYYCIPHGAPGGIGMAGSIQVQDRCVNDSIRGTLNFNYTTSSGNGFNIYLDSVGLEGNPYTDPGTGVFSFQVDLPHDTTDHILAVEDAGMVACRGETTFKLPPCDTDSCDLSVSLIEVSDCTGVEAEVTIEIHSSLINKNLVVTRGTNLIHEFSTDQNGSAAIAFHMTANGSDAKLYIYARDNENCIDSLQVSLPDCVGPCLITDFDPDAGPQKYIVEVQDFDYAPKDLTVLPGDTILFKWTGNIPHTVTSDAVTGPDAFNSGLLGRGSEYMLILSTVGDHPYYCIPHGGPGGIGMAGSVTVEDTCIGSTWRSNMVFNVSAGSSLGYNLFLNGSRLNTEPLQYENPLGKNSVILEIPADGRTGNLTIQDVETPFCAYTAPVTSYKCDTTCVFGSLDINTEEDIIHVIEVRDYDFSPASLTVRAGETVRFLWTGVIPHTSTSDKFDGSDSWNSGLLGEGAVFDIKLDSPGEHPYYCIPHGGPGGIGMAGIITVLPACLDGKQNVELSFEVANGSGQGYRIFRNGALVNSMLHPYQNRNGVNTINLELPGDGNSHIITLQDALTPFCARSNNYQSSFCGEACSISGLRQLPPSAETHTILVRDFDYSPAQSNIELGDTLLFVWEGVVPHTVTSDAATGANVFNSGLLGEGSEFIVVPTETGPLPYYCIPHGGPGGIGMAGTVMVHDPCEDGYIDFKFSFQRESGSQGYIVKLNGQEVHTSNYQPGPFQQFDLSLPADGSDLNLEVLDIEDADCRQELFIPGFDCNDPCFTLDASFVHSIDPATLTAVFSDASTGNTIVTWHWNFGDGNTSSEANPVHNYTQSGAYEVCLEITDAEGCKDEYCDKINFDIIPCALDFEYDIQGLTVTFVNTSEISSSSPEIVWDFDDGFAALNVQTTTHTFEPGIYEVCLLINSPGCTDVVCQTLDLSSPCIDYTADFVYDEVPGAPRSVKFFDLSDARSNIWLWGFGDGSTSTEQNPVHQYTEDGLYNVCLLVQDSLTGCSESYCEELAVGITSVTEGNITDDIRIFPNPLDRGAQTLYIKGLDRLNRTGEAIVRIYNIYGQTVMTTSVIADEIMSVSTNLTPGIYFLEFVERQKSITKMVVIQ